MQQSLITIAYIAASALFILSLGGLSQQTTARRGNLYGILGMLIALVATGAGMWTSATGLGTVQRRYLDPVSGQAVYFGLVNEAAGPAVVSLRIKVEDRRIVEAEWVIGRKGDALYSPGGLTAEPPRDAVRAPGAAFGREAMIMAAISYFDGLQGHDGNLVQNNAGCVRLENGTRVTGRAAPAAPGGPGTVPCEPNISHRN